MLAFEGRRQELPGCARATIADPASFRNISTIFVYIEGYRQIIVIFERRRLRGGRPNSTLPLDFFESLRAFGGRKHCRAAASCGVIHP